MKPSSHHCGKNSGFRNWRVTTDGFARKDGDRMDTGCDMLLYCAIVTRYGPTMPTSAPSPFETLVRRRGRIGVWYRILSSGVIIIFVL